jgi:magnesium transporter
MPTASLPSHATKDHLGGRISNFLSPGPPPLRVDQTIGQALEAIRRTGLEERIFYFYVVDSEGCLCGVVPARKLLTEPIERKIDEVMMKRVLSLPESATLMEACECFILHKFLAIPVIDSEKRLRGIVDVGLFTDEVMELSTGNNSDQLFQSIGIHVQEALHASPDRFLENFLRLSCFNPQLSDTRFPANHSRLIHRQNVWQTNGRPWKK